MMRLDSALAAAVVATVMGCASFPTAEESRTVGEEMVREAYPGMPETLTRRTIQDADQKLCSTIGGARLTADEAAQVVQSARASMRYPDGGRLAGDWKTGERLANDAVGMRVRDGRVEQVKENGALCINCHALDPKEVNAGNLGPPLSGYGVRNGNSEAAVKYAYEKIYNAWVYFPCSNMPRLGHNGFLTPQQIAHVVAYLTDPQSPVNRN
jgi:sulfur-oxidizing protein SoxX